ncbi:hypothetical protein BD410DRAFT_844106 [Rickenella mellea]|uniref:Fungal-type protein kinase domain-containing protein n=1 Tax=Rickenella mellea TaxID=50990 RepID=A0A4Y7PP90_9AGAM|nr:hypothetical protein BD410DRAFT_844106 [Rickenella mellea]
MHPRKCGIRRKPDIVLVDIRQSSTSRRWQDTHSIAELTVSRFSRGILDALTVKASHIFRTQENRLFVVMIALCFESVYLCVFDRAGVLISHEYNVHAHPDAFLRIMVGLLFADPAMIGLDDTVTISNGAVKRVAVKRSFEIERTLFKTEAIRGTAATYWHAVRGNKNYVIKDTWHDISLPRTEAQILAKLVDIEGVPRVVETARVTVPVIECRVDDTTDRRRRDMGRVGLTQSRMQFKKLENRIHLRMVMQPLASSIWKFSTKRELISALIDILTIHENVYEHGGVLHRGISINNLMLYKPAAFGSLAATSEPAAREDGIRRGMLTDFTPAVVMTDAESNTEHEVRSKLGTDTVAFMSWDVLIDYPKIKHLPQHDLESLYYVFIWICVSCGGPNGKPRNADDFIQHDVFEQWMNGTSPFSNIAANKHTYFTDGDQFERKILASFSPYFKDLKPCCSKLRALIFGHDKPSVATHHMMRSILLETLQSLAVEISPSGTAPINIPTLDPSDFGEDPEAMDVDVDDEPLATAAREIQSGGEDEPRDDGYDDSDESDDDFDDFDSDEDEDVRWQPIQNTMRYTVDLRRAFPSF